MTLPVWDGTLPPEALPVAEPVVVELLRRMLPGVIDIATPRSNPSTKRSYPFIRVVHTNDREVPSDWERTPIVQLSVWATTEGEASDLAAFIAYAWPMVRDSETAEGYISGGWVESEPRLTAPVQSEPPRYDVAVGFHLHSRSPL